MSTYPLRVRSNILPLSVGSSLPSAFEEWEFSGKTYDHEDAVEVCGLCDQHELRYHFEIVNKFTNSSLWVGSKCILKFDLAVIENGIRLSASSAKKYLAKLTKKMQLDSCLNALEKLKLKESNPILSNALLYYKTNKKLTPKYAYVVFWKLQQFGIDHHASFFKIDLSRQSRVDDLRDMPTNRVHKFWTALSPSQRKTAISLGHTAPSGQEK